MFTSLSQFTHFGYRYLSFVTVTEIKVKLITLFSNSSSQYSIWSMLKFTTKSYCNKYYNNRTANRMSVRASWLRFLFLARYSCSKINVSFFFFLRRTDSARFQVPLHLNLAADGISRITCLALCWLTCYVYMYVYYVSAITDASVRANRRAPLTAFHLRTPDLTSQQKIISFQFLLLPEKN